LRGYATTPASKFNWLRRSGNVVAINLIEFRGVHGVD
jgi:hypothetical protein